MKNEIREYLSVVENDLHERENIDEQYISELLIRIGFYQHERLVHLIVTMTFALMTVLSFAMMFMGGGIPSVLLALLFLGLTIPYIYHYYFLENSVQKLYTLYYKALKIQKDNKNIKDSHGDKIH